mmetsp:Transcript_12478/g.29390  ORF Transcript_12478/g.29390 Transcript_12478/m.29390 type:complete len:666 (-) Transcript_12478:174-2171(-)
MARSPSASRPRSRKRTSRSRRRAERSRSRDRGRSRKDRSRSRKRSRSRSKARARTRSRSKSRRPKKRGATPERVPPTSFSDYEPVAEGSGWYLYKKTGKWKYHPETGLYLHVKSDVYYVQKEGDPKAFRRIEDDDDHIIKKMKQSEEMRKAIQATEFVQFHKEDNGKNAAPPSDGAASSQPPPPPPVDATPPIGVPGPPIPVGPSSFVPAAPPPEAKAAQQSADDKKCEGKVREWNVEKGFGFIAPLGEEAESKSIFVHLWNVVGSSHSNPINLREGARVQYKLGEQDGKERALDVVMLGKDGKPLPIHAGAQKLEEKRKSYYVTAASLSVRVHTESWPGKQSELTDRYVSDQPMEELGVYFGCFDGHNGAQVSEIASKQLHKNILAQFRQKQVQPASRDEKIKAAVKEAFLQTDKEILSVAERKKFEQVGSTALVALLHGNPKLGSPLRLVLAHVGDSRGVLCRAGQAVSISEDHRPDKLEEKKRIERAGGLVLNVRGAWRIAAPANPKASNKASRRQYQGVSLTRSLGDLSFKQPNFLVADPDIKVMTLCDKDLFLVLATDGVFSVLQNQEVVDLAIRNWDDPEAASKNIVRKAFQKGADENLTAMVIQFGWSDKGAPGFVARRQAMVAKGLDGGSPTFKPKDKAADAAAAAVSAVDDQDIFG